MKKRRWQMLDDYATLQMKPLFAWKAIYHSRTNCPYFLSDLQSKTPNKKAHSIKINRLTRRKRTIWEA